MLYIHIYIYIYTQTYSHLEDQVNISHFKREQTRLCFSHERQRELEEERVAVLEESFDEVEESSEGEHVHAQTDQPFRSVRL